MTWSQLDYPFMFDTQIQNRSRIGSSTVNEQCFIRKQHKCGKMHGASKSCFIACPTNDDIEPILEIMSEKLTKLGIEPIIAVKERAYGQDIFCTKICGKIIESRFCIVILDDAVKGGTNVPTPNVYYEYGLMTALRKHIIPLQKEDLELAFNIQSYDTIKYNPRNVGAELDRAIRDAVKLTEAVETEKIGEAIVDKVILRKMEMAGFDEKDEKWFLSEVISDTAFRGFGQHEKKFYVYMGKIDTHDDEKTYLDDLSVVVFRTEKKAKSLMEEIETLKAQRERALEKVSQKEEVPVLGGGVIMRRFDIPEQSLGAFDAKIIDKEEKLELMSTIFIPFTVAPDIDVTEFMKIASSVVVGNDRYRLTFSQFGKIEFGDISVDFNTNQH